MERQACPLSDNSARSDRALLALSSSPINSATAMPSRWRACPLSDNPVCSAATLSPLWKLCAFSNKPAPSETDLPSQLQTCPVSDNPALFLICFGLSYAPLFSPLKNFSATATSPLSHTSTTFPAPLPPIHLYRHLLRISFRHLVSLTEMSKRKIHRHHKNNHGSSAGSASNFNMAASPSTPLLLPLDG